MQLRLSLRACEIQLMIFFKVSERLPSVDGYVLARNKHGKQARVMYRARFDARRWLAFFGADNRLHEVLEWKQE